MERDPATHHLAAGDPVLVIAALDPKHTRDHPVVPHMYDWRGPMTAFQLAEAYRAQGDEPASRIDRRAQESVRSNRPRCRPETSVHR